MTRNPVLKKTLRACALLFAGCASTFLIMREQEKANPPQPEQTSAETTESETPTQTGVGQETMIHSSKGFTMDGNPALLFSSKSATIDGSEFIDPEELFPTFEPSGTVNLFSSKSLPPNALIQPRSEGYLPSSKFAPLDLINDEEPGGSPVYIMGSKSGFISPVDFEENEVAVPAESDPVFLPSSKSVRIVPTDKPKPISYLGSSKNSVTLPPGTDMDVELHEVGTVTVTPIVVKPVQEPKSKPTPTVDKKDGESR